MKNIASSEQVVFAREAARRTLVACRGESRRTMRRHLRSEILRYGDMSMYILLFRLALFILGWWLANNVSEPSSVMTSAEPWADQEQFEFESDEVDDA
jgi:hypothetical protein